MTLAMLRKVAAQLGARVERTRDGVEVFAPDGCEWDGGIHSIVVLLVDPSDGVTALDPRTKADVLRDAIDRVLGGHAPCDPDCEGLA